MAITGIFLDVIAEAWVESLGQKLETLRSWERRIPGETVLTEVYGSTPQVLQAFFRTIVADTRTDGPVNDTYIAELQEKFAGKPATKKRRRRFRDDPYVRELDFNDDDAMSDLIVKSSLKR